MIDTNGLIASTSVALLKRLNLPATDENLKEVAFHLCVVYELGLGRSADTLLTIMQEGKSKLNSPTPKPPTLTLVK